jgi:hypothetical protein
VREIRTLRAMWRALETGFSLKIYAPALDPTGIHKMVAISGISDATASKLSDRRRPT